ncbi:MAG: cache domain-containing protein [Polyangiaceae bacterium]
MGLLRRITISMRLLLMGSVTSAVTLGVALAFLVVVAKVRDYGVSAAANAALDGQKAMLVTSVDSMAQIVGAALEGAQSDREKVAIMTKLVSPVRYGADKSGYFFIYRGTVVVVLPPKPSLAGTDRAAAVDKNGVKYVSELYRNAGTDRFVRYVYPKPGVKDEVGKLSYSQYIPGTDYWIGSGVYVEQRRSTAHRFEHGDCDDCRQRDQTAHHGDCARVPVHHPAWDLAHVALHRATAQ